MHCKGKAVLGYEPFCRLSRLLVEGKGGLAQMVERSLSMREVAGSMPASSSGYPAFMVDHQHAQGDGLHSSSSRAG